ncbi:MAG: hypothetical protein LBB72_07855 [Spirochaetaceae bacterium]|jgi:hypothetical protein|nr:hypothetical protein [Spirochaetaceae bacterium]
MECNSIAPKRDPEDAQELIPELWEGFKENYLALKRGEMKLEDEPKYRGISSPGPSQYKAFLTFFSFINGEEDWIWEQRDNMHMHYIFDLSRYGGSSLLEFLQNLNSSDYDCKGKKITLVSGSFWRSNPNLRETVISILLYLCGKKAVVQAITQANETEPNMIGISRFLDRKLSFNTEKRRPIHFVLVEDKYLFYEFPHTESTWFRLNMFLDLDKIPYKKGKSKAGLLRFFNKIIKGKL